MPTSPSELKNPLPDLVWIHPARSLSHSAQQALWPNNKSLSHLATETGGQCGSWVQKKRKENERLLYCPVWTSGVSWCNRGEIVQGVTIPSQRRYVSYYSEFLQSQRSYRPARMMLHALRLEPPPPCINGGGQCSLFITAVFIWHINLLVWRVILVVIS